MHRTSVLASVLLGFVSTALGVANDQSCSKGALNYLACRNGIPHNCIPEIASQAVEFCSSYLAVTTTRLVTANRVATVTVTKTQTLGTTATQTSISTTGTTAIQVSTVTSTTATSTTTVTSFVAPEIVSISTLVPRDAPRSRCPDLSEKKLTQLPAEKLSSVCKCLGVTPTTVVATTTTAVTSTSTASATSTTTTTTTVTTIVVSSSTTTTTTTTTTTVSNVATATATVDACSVTFNPSGNGVGNTVLTPGVASARDCCILCWNTLDCVASAFPGSCQLLVKTTPLSGAPISATCPLGIENYDFRPGPGVVYVGPCGVPPAA